MSALRELLATFHIEVDDSELKEGEKQVEGFLDTLKQVGRVVAEAFAVDQLKEFLESEIQVGAELKVMSERLGLGTDELQALQLAAGQAGVSNDALSTSLRFLNRNIGEANKGGNEQAATFQKLGIHLKDAEGNTRSVGDVMEDLANSVASIPDAARQTNVAMQLLGRGGAQLIPLLKQGGKAFAEAREQMVELGGGLSDEFVEAAHEAEAANVRLEFSWKSLRAQVASAIFPALGELVKWLTTATASLVKFNKETGALTTAVQFFGAFAAYKMIGSLRDLIPLVEKLAKAIGITDVALFGLEIPALAVIALIGLLYLAFDDVYGLMTGKESVIGDTLDELFGIGTAAQFAKDLGEAFSAFVDILANVGNIVYQTLVTPFEAALEAAKGVGEALGDIAGGHFAQAVADLQKAGDTMGKLSEKRSNNILDAFGSLGEDFTGTKNSRRQHRIDRQIARGEQAPEYKPGGELFTGPLAPAPAYVPRNIYGSPMAASGEGGTVVHQTNETKVEVHTSSNQPRAIGDAVGQGVAHAHQRANERLHTAKRKP